MKPTKNIAFDWFHPKFEKVINTKPFSTLTISPTPHF